MADKILLLKELSTQRIRLNKYSENLLKLRLSTINLLKGTSSSVGKTPGCGTQVTQTKLGRGGKHYHSLTPDLPKNLTTQMDYGMTRCSDRVIESL